MHKFVCAYISINALPLLLENIKTFPEKKNFIRNFITSFIIRADQDFSWIINLCTYEQMRISSSDSYTGSTVNWFFQSY